MKQILATRAEITSSFDFVIVCLFVMLGLCLLYIMGYSLVRIIRIRGWKKNFYRLVQSYKDNPDKLAIENKINIVLQRLLDQYEELIGMTIGELFRLKKPNFLQLRLRSKVELYYNQVDEIKKSVDEHKNEGIAVES